MQQLFDMGVLIALERFRWLQRVFPEEEEEVIFATYLDQRLVFEGPINSLQPSIYLLLYVPSKNIYLPHKAFQRPL